MSQFLHNKIMYCFRQNLWSGPHVLYIAFWVAAIMLDTRQFIIAFQHAANTITFPTFQGFIIRHSSTMCKCLNSCTLCLLNVEIIVIISLFLSEIEFVSLVVYLLNVLLSQCRCLWNELLEEVHCLIHCQCIEQRLDLFAPIDRFQSNRPRQYRLALCPNSIDN